MNPFTVKSYWKSYKGLPKKIQRDADRKFDLWKKNPFHPSLNFKCVNAEYNRGEKALYQKFQRDPSLVARSGAAFRLSVTWSEAFGRQKEFCRCLEFRTQ